MKFKTNNRTWSIEEKSQSEIKSIQNQRKANIDNYITHREKEYLEEEVADIVSNSYDIIHEIVDKYFK